MISLLAASSSYYANADNLLSTYQQALQNDPAILKAKALFLASEEDIKFLNRNIIFEKKKMSFYKRKWNNFVLFFKYRKLQKQEYDIFILSPKSYNETE